MDLPPLERCEHTLPVDEFGTTSQLLNELGQGDDPVAIMLTCWELGGAPIEVSHANPGEVMVVQNPGGMVPAEGLDDESGTLGSVSLGLSYPTVRHLIVCGHTECKTLQLALVEETEREKNPFRKSMLRVRERFAATYSDRPARDRLCIIVQETILQQLANLRSHTCIESRLRKGTLLLHGWIRDDHRSTIAAYDAVTGQFCG